MSSKEPAPPSASWRWAKRVVPPFARRRIGGIRKWLRHRPPVGLVRFGSLRRVTPISRRWGYDRGLPIDRYYIEAFVEEHRRDIRGTVLEVREPGYTYQFGSDVKHSEVIDIDPDNTVATIVADLADAPQVPDGSFDCVIVTQTLQLIYDVRAAVDTIHRVLKPRGVVLATFPGISPVASEAETDHWRFTIESATRVFADRFGDGAVEVRSYGNVLTATAFLFGLASRELRAGELAVHDPRYGLVVAVRAVRPS
jgi:SAM-dependent methyltransferase